jgi:hypothetical protein
VTYAIAAVFAVGSSAFVAYGSWQAQKLIRQFRDVEAMFAEASMVVEASSKAGEGQP